VLLVSAAYAGSVAFAALKAWATGAPINLGLLATSPLDSDALLYIPMITGVVVLETLPGMASAVLSWRRGRVTALPHGLNQSS
jgi:predicted branched-subunit amino acid permease